MLVAWIAGACVAASPLADAVRFGLREAAHVYAVLGPAPGRPEVALVLLDPEALAHPAFAARPLADWTAPLAEVLEALLDAGASVVGVDVIQPDDARVDARWLQALRRGSREGRVILGMAAGTHQLLPSAAQRAAAGGAPSLAHINLPVDDDGVVRRIGHDGSLGAMVATRAGARPHTPALLPAALAPDFITWSAGEVLARRGQPSLVEAFAGRVVLLGAWLPDSDRHRGPDGPMPGVALHANAAHLWLTDGGPRALPLWVERLIVLVAGTAGALATFAAPPLTAILLTVATIVLGLLALPLGWAVPWLGAACATLVAYGVGRAARHAHHARLFLNAFPRRFPVDLNAGRQEHITVMFLDIVSFTRVSETCAPGRLAHDLGGCLTRFEHVIEEYGGFVDKYLGDGLIALFGVGLRDGGCQHAWGAARACLALCGHPTARLGDQPVQIRLGLASGIAHVGRLGAPNRVHFTAIGDVVNVAARLEQLNRDLGTTVLVDAAIVAANPGELWRDCGQQALRGRAAHVRVWTVGATGGGL